MYRAVMQERPDTAAHLPSEAVALGWSRPLWSDRLSFAAADASQDDKLNG